MRFVVLAAALFAALPAAAQHRPVIGVGLSAGTMGVAVDGAVQLTSRIGVRGRVAAMPYEPELEFDGIRYTFALPSPQAGLFADLFLVGPLRLTGGLRYAADDYSITAEVTGSVEIGDVTYTAAEVGTLTGAVSSRAAGPYIGIGLGRVAGRGVGVFFDAGVSFHDSPVASLSSSGGSLSNNAAFQAELDRELTRFNGDIESYSFYPVVALGLRVGF